MKPNASAVATSLRAPSLAPSGANTELQECANESISEPPHDSPLAFSSSTPSSVAAVCTGKLSFALTAFAWSADDSVMILNDEPGGCGAENATPASAEHLAGARTHRRDPAVAAGQRRDRRALDVGVDRSCARSCRAAAGGWRAHALPARSSPPGVPVELGVELALEAGEADRRSRRARRARRAPRRARAARARGVPAISEAAGSRSEERSSPRAITLAVAGTERRARGQARAARQLLARLQAREHELRVPGDRRVAVGVLADRERERLVDVAEDPRLHGDRDGDHVVARVRGAAGHELRGRRRGGGVAIGVREVGDRACDFCVSGVSIACIAA